MTAGRDINITESGLSEAEMDKKVEEHCEELKEFLSNKIDNLVQEEANESHAMLQLDQEFPPLDCDVGCVNSRKDISSILCTQPSGDVDLYNKIASEWLHPHCDKSKQRIAIVGQSQVGKTQILKKLLKDIRKKYDYLFYISLKFVNSSDKMNILQFLTDQSSLRWIDYQSDEDHKLFKRVVERLNGIGKKQEKVCIIFDDLEKSNFSYDDYFYDKSYYDKVEAGYFVTNILRKWFRNGQKILLLDPWQFFQLYQENELRPMDVVHVLGIDHVEQKRLVEDHKLGCSRENCNLREMCLGFATTCHAQNCSVCGGCHDDNCHHDIQSLCYIPCNCMRLVELRNVLPLSSVAVAASILGPKLTSAFRHISKSRESCRFSEVGSFAWKQYAMNVFVFDESDLLNSDLSRKEINVFFSSKNENSSFPSGINEDLVFFFSHVLMQELLAALWLLSLSKEKFKDEVMIHEESFSNGNFIVVCEFMREICKQRKCLKMYKFCKVQSGNLKELPVVLVN